MKGIILYQSKYGATKQYVRWIEEKTGFVVVETKRATVNQVEAFDVIILAGGIYASGIAGMKFLKKNYSSIRDKRVAVFCVGASPYEPEAFKAVRQRNCKGELSKLPCFYGRGKWEEESMTFVDRKMCSLLKKSVAKKDPATWEPWEEALMETLGENADWTDPSYLEPLLEWIENYK